MQFSSRTLLITLKAFHKLLICTDEVTVECCHTNDETKMIFGGGGWVGGGGVPEAKGCFPI